MSLPQSGGFSMVRRALRRNTRAESPSITVSAGQVDVHQVFYVNATQGVMQVRKVSVWIEAADATETATLNKVSSGTAIESGTAILSTAAFDISQSADTLYEPALSATKGALFLKPGDALGIVLSAGTDTANFCLTVDLIPF